MKNKVIIIYKSSTGFTKKYAEMISEETGCSLVDYKTANAEMLSDYSIVVFGSRAHAGMIDGYKKLKEMFEKSNADKLVLFVTGAMPNAAEETIKAFWEQNLTDDELTKIPHFYMQGGLCYERMTLSDRLMMKVVATVIKRKKEKTKWEQDFEQAISGSYDISDRKYIMPLVAWLKEVSVEEKEKTK